MALLDLPAELLCMIAHQLPAPSLNNLRLTHRELWIKTEHAFDEPILETRWRIAEDSLATLLKIVRTPRLQQKLVRLQISSCFLHEGLELSPGHLRTSLCMKPTCQQWAYLASDKPEALLTLILSSLPHLREIEMGQWCKSVDETEAGWGGTALMERTGEALHDSSYNGPCTDATREMSLYSGLTICAEKMLAALAVAAPRLERFSVLHWDSMDLICGVEVPQMPTLELHSPISTGLQSAFATLTSLQLCMGYNDIEAKYSPRLNDDSFGWLTHVVKLMPALKSVWLAFEGLEHRYEETGDDGETTDEIVPQALLGATKTFLKHAHLEHLESFELYNVVCPGPDMLSFLRRHASTLKRLVLHHVQLPDSDKHTLPWNHLFSDLQEHQTLNLQHIALSNLYNGIGPAIVFGTEGLAGCLKCTTIPHADSPVFADRATSHHAYTSSAGVLPEMLSNGEIKRARAIV